MKKYIWKIAAVIVGAGLGYAYYYYIGCSSGVCPLTSNPWISTGYGSLLGLIIASSSKKGKTGEQQERK